MLLLLSSSWMDVVVAFKEKENQSNVEYSKSKFKRVVLVPSSSGFPAQRKTQPWFTPKGRMFTLSSGPSREGSGH